MMKDVVLKLQLFTDLDAMEMISSIKMSGSSRVSAIRRQWVPEPFRTFCSGFLP
jgi:hypothetical protein